jgi:Putative adhesin
MLRTNLLILTLGFFISNLSAQTTLEVAVKTIEKTLPYKPGYELSIEGEKADVIVQAGANSVVKVLIEITSKNPNLEEAKKDLEQVHFDAEVQGRKVILRNYTKPYNNGDKPKSSLRTAYRIYVPSECAVALKNTFGKANISNLFKFFHSRTEFCNVTLQNMKGKINVDSRFGDIVGKQLDGDVRINARRSNVSLSQLRGTYNLNMYYGKANIMADAGQINLNVIGENADVTFFPYGKTYNYDLAAKGGEISLPQNLSFSINDNGANGKSAFFKPQNTQQLITIKINMGNVKVVN